MPSTVVIIVWYEGGLLSLSTVLWKEKGCNVVSLLFVVTLMDTCAQCLLHLNLQGRRNRGEGVGGVHGHPQILTDQLYWGRGADYAPNVTTCPHQVFRPS